MPMRYFTPFCIGLLLLGSCTPPPPVNESRDVLWSHFGNHSVDDVLYGWGVPSAESKLTNGSRLLTYSRAITYDAASPYENTSGCQVSFIAPPPKFRIENIKMEGDGYQCAALAAKGPGYSRNAYVPPPPPPLLYPGVGMGAGFYYR